MGITCETVYGNSINCNATPLDKTSNYCTVDVNYIYTVTNGGRTTKNIKSLYKTFNGNVKDLTPDLDTTAIVICQEETTLSVYADLDATLPSGTTCENTDVYEIDVEKICDVEVEAECLLADDINNDCRLIPPVEYPEDCEVVVEYSYTVTNTSPKHQTVDKVVWNFNGDDNDMT